MKATVYVLKPRFCSYYRVTDDFLCGDFSAIRQGALLEVGWPTFRPGELRVEELRLGELHAIELTDWRVILRFVRAVASKGRAFEIHGGNESERELLPLAFVRRIGRVRRVLYAQYTGAGQQEPASIVHMGAWLSAHPRLTSRRPSAKKGGAV